MQHRPAPLFLGILGLTVLVSACASPSGKFPSLERRPYETSDPLALPDSVVPVTPVRLSPELSSKVAALTRRHDNAAAAFFKRLPEMQAVASRAANTSAGTEAWVNAHLQLSRLDRLRADSVAALGEFDALIADQIEPSSDQVALLVEAQQALAGDVAVQREHIDRLSRQIGE